jgi:hypothetical protein
MAKKQKGQEVKKNPELPETLQTVLFSLCRERKGYISYKDLELIMSYDQISVLVGQKLVRFIPRAMSYEVTPKGWELFCSKQASTEPELVAV